MIHVDDDLVGDGLPCLSARTGGSVTEGSMGLSNPNVAVLMATYNGEPYLSAQIQYGPQ